MRQIKGNSKMLCAVFFQRWILKQKKSQIKNAKYPELVFSFARAQIVDYI